ncbi:hypothetical protein COU80_00525 [Candidatus Peregrinibacteria bacterium CG10_big_fil_rev_8_21_14_0_10_55_24]|nr:MAG: hypothetical protein COU80_00525 [Candidatus Peregrinibacteria bacterium CG10_big_fil_rev_8_21_14_0_10_55_24]
MKHILFLLFLVGFIWVSFVPPEGMSKLPAVNVKFQYSRENGQIKLRVEQLDSSSSAQSAGATSTEDDN